MRPAIVGWYILAYMLAIAFPTIISGIVLLLVRIVLFVTFFAEAKFKFKDIRAFSKSDGIPLPLSYVVASAELLAAIGMLTGILAPWAGLGIVLLMLGTTSMQIFKWHNKYWANKGGWEYDLLMLTLGAVVAVFGSGLFSIPYLLQVI